MQSQNSFFEFKRLWSVLWMAAFVLAAACCVLAVQSRSWDMLLDVPIYHYISWLMSNGAVPYRDIFDQNFPGTFYLHLLVRHLLGPSDAAWRLFDLVWLLITNIYIFICCRKFGLLPAVLATLLFSSYHLTNGPLCSGQRDFLMVLFLVAAGYYCAASIERTLSAGRMLAAGVLCGCSCMIKPHSGVFFILLIFLILIYGRRLRRSCLRSVVVLCLGFCVIPLLVFALLASTGGLGAFLDIIFHYLLPIYSKLTRLPLIASIASAKVFGVNSIVLASFLCMAYCAILLKSGRVDVRRAVLLSGILYGIVHYISQGRGWSYHLYPMAAFMLMLLVSLLDSAQASKAFFLRVLIAGCCAYLAAASIVKTIHTIVYPPDFTLREVYMLENDLQAYCKEGCSIQALDYNGLSLQAFFRLQYPIATRFVLTFHLFFAIEEPYVQLLRKEFIDTLREDPPELLVVCRDSWNITDYMYLQTFPELVQFIESGYRLLVEKKIYRIYGRSQVVHEAQ